jgi:hypothetical protein
LSITPPPWPPKLIYISSASLPALTSAIRSKTQLPFQGQHGSGNSQQESWSLSSRQKEGRFSRKPGSRRWYHRSEKGTFQRRSSDLSISRPLFFFYPPRGPLDKKNTGCPSLLAIDMIGKATITVFRRFYL